jgi:hypothetical protein
MHTPLGVDGAHENMAPARLAGGQEESWMSLYPSQPVEAACRLYCCLIVEVHCKNVIPNSPKECSPGIKSFRPAASANDLVGLVDD